MSPRLEKALSKFGQALQNMVHSLVGVDQGLEFVISISLTLQQQDNQVLVGLIC